MVDGYPALSLGFCRSAGSCSHEGNWKAGIDFVCESVVGDGKMASVVAAENMSSAGAVEERRELNHSAFVFGSAEAEAVRETKDIGEVDMEAVRPGMCGDCCSDES